MSVDNRVVLDYTSRDYKAIRANLVGLAQGFLPEWETVGETGDFGTLLLELFAYSGDIMNYYIDRVGAEAFLGTATRRQSVMFIADMLGYTPVGQQSARVPLTFSWVWDSAATQISVTRYSLVSQKVENGVATLKVTSPDTAVALEVGQTFSVSGTRNTPYSDYLTVESFTPATDTSPAIVTAFLPENLTGFEQEENPSVIGLSLVTGNAIVVPKGTLVSSQPDELGQSVVFELESDVLLDSALATQVPTVGYTGAPEDDPSTIFSVTANGTAIEGVTVPPSSLGVSKGVPNADLVLTDVGIIDNSLTIYTKEGGAVVVWSRISNLAVAGPDQSVFSYYVDDQGQTHVLFGDGASGRVPPVSSEIFAGYRVGVGARANSLDIGTVTNLGNDFASGAGVTVSNTAQPIGGSDIESIESMRFSIPRATAVRRRAVNPDDYKNLALQVPGVTKAVAYGDSYTSVFVRIASSDQSRALVVDRTPRMRVLNNIATVVTEADHSVDLHPGDSVYLSTRMATGNLTIKKVWEGQPTSLTEISSYSRTLRTDISGNPRSVVTLKCPTAHGLLPGQPFTVTGLPDLYEGTWIVASVPDMARKTLEYIVSDFDDPTSPGGDYVPNTPSGNVAETAVLPGEGAVFASPGLDLAFVGSDTPYTKTSPPEPTKTPNLSYSDPQMRDLINATESYISDKDLIGAKVYAEAVEWTNVNVSAVVTVRNLYNRTAVRDAVKAAISGVFDYDNVDFGQRISLGEVYRAALAVDGVEFVNLTAMYVSDPVLSTSPAAGPNVVVPPTISVGDIATPERNLPRINPAILSDNWVTATGGLVNT